MLRYASSLVIIVAVTGTAAADLVEVLIPQTRLATMLQGKLTFNPGGTVTLRHELGTLYFSKDNILNNHKVPPIETTVRHAIDRSKNADEAMQAARKALKHGLISEVYRAAALALKFDPQHADANRVKQLYRTLRTPLPPSTEEESDLKKAVRLSSMVIDTSPHFILLHDTPRTPPKPASKKSRRRRPRYEERLALLEKVYESFLLKFYSQGIALEIPQRRLKVVLFNDDDDFYDFATSLSPSLRSALGFYDPRTNISFFFDHGSSKRMAPLRALSTALQKRIPDAMKSKDGEFIRLAETITLLVEIDRENSDIEVVTHEATHQMAGNTGLLPRHVLVPSWVHEGLATYFEAPDEATWSGMGAVNGERLEWYRALAAHPKYSSLDFVVGDQIFKYARSHGAILHGYGQAWALTHFLMEKHFKEFMMYYRRIGEMPPDLVLSPDVLNKVFDQVFTVDRATLDREWRSYMRSLKTDTERILGR